MSRSFPALALFAALVLGGLATRAAAQARFDHVYVIVLENHDFDDAFSAERTPFLDRLAREQGLATQYFGVAHPSLPNYIALVSGDTFGVADDAPSCFASDLAPAQPCHRAEGESLADQLEATGLSFAGYFESAPSTGALQQGHPDPLLRPLYAQKHNPFVYFDRIAEASARRADLKPYDALAADLAGKIANFVLIVPDQCHDGHGLRAVCMDEAQLQRDYDAFVETTVALIRSSPNWTRNSAIVVTFDEGEAQHKTPEAAATDNRIPTLVVTACGAPATSAQRYDHYALLATIEDGFGLTRLRKALGAPAMTDLFSRPCQSEPASRAETPK
ncbi:MAG TPA: alkaline phosphatase family protein [Methylocystis sp.]|nr:alkaline phosphatase family protein [Methylocystis sp.]